MNAIRFPCCAAARDVRLFDIHVITAASGTAENVVKVHHRHTSRKQTGGRRCYTTRSRPAGWLLFTHKQENSLPQTEVQTPEVDDCRRQVQFDIDIFSPHSGVRTGAGKIGHADGRFKSFARQSADNDGGG